MLTRKNNFLSDSMNLAYETLLIVLMEPTELSGTISGSKFEQLKPNNTDMKGEQAAEDTHLLYFMKDIKSLILKFKSSWDIASCARSNIHTHTHTHTLSKHKAGLGLQMAVVFPSAVYTSKVWWNCFPQRWSSQLYVLRSISTQGRCPTDTPVKHKISVTDDWSACGTEAISSHIGSKVMVPHLYRWICQADDWSWLLMVILLLNKGRRGWTNSLHDRGAKPGDTNSQQNYNTISAHSGPLTTSTRRE